MMSCTQGTILFLSMVIFGLAACGEDAISPAEQPQQDAEFNPESEPFDDLSEAKQLNAKADQAFECGQGVCSNVLCGYDCSSSGQQCQHSCAETDTRQDTFVKLQVSGAESASIDSTTLAYEPTISLSNVVFYGCQLWDFSNQKYDGLEIQYRDIRKGAFLVGGPHDYGVEAHIYIKPFEGPGTYVAEGFVSMNSARRQENDYYYQKQSCGVSVDVDAQGTVSGEIFCEEVAHKSDTRKLKVTGSFSCGKNSLQHPNIVRRLN